MDPCRLVVRSRPWWDAGRRRPGFGGRAGACGACAVLVDGVPVRSCLMLAVQTHEHAITTVEGLASGPEAMHPLQQAFWEKHGLQCGFCTPGFLMTLLPFLQG